MKRKFTLIMTLLLMTIFGRAQERNVSGVVTSAEDDLHKAEDLYDDFDTPGTMEWFFQGGDDGSLAEDFTNPDASGINISTLVAKYVRGTSFEWTNAQFVLDYRMDLTQRNQFTIKVYFPSSNTQLSQANQTVAIKLQDSTLGGNAWITQVEKKLEVTQLDQWVELQFDFSAPEIISRTDLDQIVLQIGGEGHFEPATFYFDDLLLLGGGGTGGYSLVWNDEFETPGAPNQAKWGYDLGNGQNGWGNEELQYYTDNSSDSIIADGKLIITAKKEMAGGFNYTSARLKTQNKYSFQYGRIDVSAKLPGGVGIWPAIWMLGNNVTSVGWPVCGEVDIMEHVGYEPDQIHGSIHTTSSSGATVNTEVKTVAGCKDDFHVYSIEWDDQEIRFYVDNSNYYTYHPDTYNNDTWPFNQEMFIILNVAVGGTWGGAQGVDDGIFPQSMEVDYVRVYQKN